MSQINSESITRWYFTVYIPLFAYFRLIHTGCFIYRFASLSFAGRSAQLVCHVLKSGRKTGNISYFHKHLLLQFSQINTHVRILLQFLLINTFTLVLFICIYAVSTSYLHTVYKFSLVQFSLQGLFTIIQLYQFINLHQDKNFKSRILILKAVS